MFQISLWRTWLVMLYTERTEVTQFLNGTWSAIWGLFIATSTVFATAPHVYGWMHPIPEWAWGAAWIAKGLWQAWAVLSFWRARLMGEELLRQRALSHSFSAAFVNVITSCCLMWGFERSLGAWNLWSAYHVALCAVSVWCLWRISGERKATAGETSPIEDEVSSIAGEASAEQGVPAPHIAPSQTSPTPTNTSPTPINTSPTPINTSPTPTN